MSRKITDGYIDDLPEALSLEDESDVEAAFWDEFFFMEQKDLFDKNVYTITIEDELTGEKKTIKHVQLSRMGKNKQRIS
ncbi:hypothetical protein A3B57_03475 [Microgenomates group bacterium RIFCSPLOWO2_01_FULL_47_10]|nr:MAG: hypothetical protein A3B57_03475 [Microgenomates group bacterium RIFCSPLOWO2_01_FULL_47_10]